jgi:myo-inositol-1-phosphate synthase
VFYKFNAFFVKTGCRFMSKARVILVGVGNATSSLIQGLEYYSKSGRSGLKYETIDGMRLEDIEIVSAYDVVKSKVGKDLNDAIFADPNVSPKFIEFTSPSGVEVKSGPVLDGISPMLAETVELVSPPANQNLAKEIIDSNAEKANLPVVGDDLQSQLGGTRIHKGILEMLNTFGAKIKNTYQLDVSGGSEGMNTLYTDRRMEKRQIKTDSIKRTLPYLTDDDIASGTTDYLDFLGNERTGYFWIYGSYFCDTPFKIDLTIKTTDGPNAAGTLVNVIRATKTALNRGIDGPLLSVSAYGFKYPPIHIGEQESLKRFEEFIAGERAD